jgi:hypothetical protein
LKHFLFYFYLFTRGFRAGILGLVFYFQMFDDFLVAGILRFAFYSMCLMTLGQVGAGFRVYFIFYNFKCG